MLKIIMVSSALFSAPAMAKAIEPVDALTGIIRMETAKQFCGLQIDRQALMELVDTVMPHVKKTPKEFVDAVRRASAQLGTDYTNNGNLGWFCAEVGRIYERHGGK